MKDTTEAALLRVQQETEEMLDEILGEGEYAFVLGIQTSDMYETQQNEEGQMVSQSSVMTNCRSMYALELLHYSTMAVTARMQRETKAETGSDDPLAHLYTDESITAFVNHLCSNSNNVEPESEEAAIVLSAMSSPIDPEDGMAPVTPATALLVRAYLDNNIDLIRASIQDTETKIKNAGNN